MSRTTWRFSDWCKWARDVQKTHGINEDFVARDAVPSGFGRRAIVEAVFHECAHMLDLGFEPLQNTEWSWTVMSEFKKLQTPYHVYEPPEARISDQREIRAIAAERLALDWYGLKFLRAIHSTLVCSSSKSERTGPELFLRDLKTSMRRLEIRNLAWRLTDVLAVLGAPNRRS